MIVILISFGIRALIKGPFYTLYKQYLGNFASSNVRTKIYSATYLFENLCSAFVAFLVSKLLAVSTTSNTFIILGVVYSLVFVVLLGRMKYHVGLNPEDYKKEDTNLTELR